MCIRDRYRRVCEAALIKGRSVLVVDLDRSNNFYIANYAPEACINWQETVANGRKTLTLAVFKEHKAKDDDDEFSHETVVQYLSLIHISEPTRLLSISYAV